MELFIDDNIADYSTYFKKIKKIKKIYIKQNKLYIYSFTYNGNLFI